MNQLITQQEISNSELLMADVIEGYFCPSLEKVNELEGL